MARIEPALWLNPWAARPIPVRLPLETITLDLATGRLESEPASQRAHEILDLTEGWPGGDPWAEVAE
jgi:hypothetical protein